MWFLVIGYWTEWVYGECDVTCGGGQKKRTRTCEGDTSDPNCQPNCDGTNEGYEPCNEDCCPGKSFFMVTHFNIICLFFDSPKVVRNVENGGITIYTYSFISNLFNKYNNSYIKYHILKEKLSIDQTLLLQNPNYTILVIICTLFSLFSTKISMHIYLN